MRAFIAIFPPAHVLDHWLKARDAAPALLNTRWTLREGLHLTVAFLGDVVEARVPEIGHLVETIALATPPLSLSLAGAGGFPSLKRPSVLWLGVDGDTAGLVAAAERMRDALRAAGFRMEDRTFHPHLTVARSPSVADERFGTLFRDYRSPMFDVDAFHLVQSHLGAAGSRYESIGRYPLSDRS